MKKIRMQNAGGDSPGTLNPKVEEQAAVNDEDAEWNAMSDLSDSNAIAPAQGRISPALGGERSGHKGVKMERQLFDPRQPTQ
jgi:hypothetical protein